jgi:hypothetical protein
MEIVYLLGKPPDISKRGVDDGNLIGGDSLQPAKENRIYYIIL